MTPREVTDTGVPAASKPVIHVVDDDVSFGDAITRVLEAAGYGVIHYTSAEQALEALPGAARGCILLDVQMPRLTGPQLQERLVQCGCALPIVFLTGFGDIATSVRAIKRGAEDFLSKPIAREALLEAVERALNRYDAEHERRITDEQLRARMARLSPREHEVFTLVVRGKMNKQIAFDLGITERTVKAHRHYIMMKLGANSLAELVSMAERFSLSNTRQTAC
jgi:FixJ family two-component response regulator